jgi:hypothetical protein
MKEKETKQKNLMNSSEINNPQNLYSQNLNESDF